MLVANHDKFPVMYNSFKVAEYATRLEKIAQGKDKKKAEAALLYLEALSHGYLDSTHVLMTPETHLNFLADWIDLRQETDSPGDLMIDLGNTGMDYSPFIWAVVAVGKLRKKEEREY